MSTPRRRPGGDDGPPHPRRDQATTARTTRTGREEPAATGAGTSSSRRTTEPADDARQRDQRAVDAATAERLSGGVRRDLHGEYAPDPYPSTQDPGDTSEDVIEHHRRQAERIEHQPDVRRATDC